MDSFHLIPDTESLGSLGSIPGFNQFTQSPAQCPFMAPQCFTGLSEGAHKNVAEVSHSK